MIVAFLFRVGPTGGPFELVSVPPRPYWMHEDGAVVADRGDRVPEDLEPCAIEHACNLCDARTLEAVADLQGDDWLAQFSRVHGDHQTVEAWWPHGAIEVGPGRLAAPTAEDEELLIAAGQAELCPDCWQRHGGVDDWPDAIVDTIYTRGPGRPRGYPEAST